MPNDYCGYMLCVDRWLLEKQIDAVCESNIDPDLLDGIHHLLGEILDQCDGRKPAAERIRERTERATP